MLNGYFLPYTSFELLHFQHAKACDNESTSIRNALRSILGNKYKITAYFGGYEHQILYQNHPLVGQKAVAKLLCHILLEIFRFANVLL